MDINSEGNAVAVWWNFLPQESSGASIWDGDSWSTPEIISDLEGGVRFRDQNVALRSEGFSSGGTAAVAVWTYGIGVSSKIQAARFEVPIPTSPSAFYGSVEKNRFLTQTDNINQLSWNPSTDPTTAGYRIYQGSLLVFQTSAAGPYEATFHNRVKGRVYTYFLVAFNSAGIESAPITITLK